VRVARVIGRPVGLGNYVEPHVAAGKEVQGWGRVGRPKRRALNNGEFIVVIALSMCCALIAGIVLAILDLPLVSGVIVTLVLTAATVVVVVRGRRASPAAALHPGVMTVEADFTMVMRGYDVAAVNAVVQRAREALASDDPGVRASAREELRQVAFPVRFRGYDRGQVDEYRRRTAEPL
jgi:DivIVA domain-containing protein